MNRFIWCTGQRFDEISKMKCFVALVINLIVFVQFSQSHSIPPTIILAESESDSDVSPPVIQDDDDENIVAEVIQPKINLKNTCKTFLLLVDYMGKVVVSEKMIRYIVPHILSLFSNVFLISTVI